MYPKTLDHIHVARWTIYVRLVTNTRGFRLTTMRIYPPLLARYGTDGDYICHELNTTNDKQMDKKAIAQLLEETFTGVRKDALGQLAGMIAIQKLDEEAVRKLIAGYSAEEVEAFAKDYRAEVDREVGNAKRKIEERFKQEPKPEPKQDPKESKEEEQEAKQDVQALIRSAIAEALKPLEDKLRGVEEERQKTDRTSRLEQVLSLCKSETMRTKALKDYGRMSFERDEDFDTYLQETKADIEAFNLSQSGGSLISPRPLSPRGAQGGERKASEAEIAEVLGKIME